MSGGSKTRSKTLPAGNNLTAGQSSVTAHAPGETADRRVRRNFADWPDITGAVDILLGAEAQERGDISHLIELGIPIDVKQFDILTDGARQDCFCYIHDFSRLPTTHGTEAHEMSVEMAAARALHGLGAVGLADQKSLHFAGFERAQHASQSCDAASAAASLT